MSLKRRLWSLASYQLRLRLGLVQGSAFSKGAHHYREPRFTVRFHLFEWFRYEESTSRTEAQRLRNVAHPYAREYSLLGVPVGADLSSVRDTWRKHVRTTHPDLYPAGSREQEAASERLRQLNECYERLRAHLE